MSKEGVRTGSVGANSTVGLATGISGHDRSASLATKPHTQAPHAPEEAVCEGRLEDPCSALSSYRHKTGHRPASSVTKNAAKRIHARARLVTGGSLFQRCYLRSA